MPSREKLSNFAEGLSRVVHPVMVQVEYEEPIDPHEICLNKIKKKRKIASFLTSTDLGDKEFRNFFSDKVRDPKYKTPTRTDVWGELSHPKGKPIPRVDNIVSIKAIVAPGTIRVPNKKYKQNQACRVEAFDMHFDMIPLTEAKAEKTSQMIVVKELTFKRFSDITSPRIPTESLEKEWNEKNKDRKEEIADPSAPRILRILPTNSVHNTTRILPF